MARGLKDAFFCAASYKEMDRSLGRRLLLQYSVCHQGRQSSAHRKKIAPVKGVLITHTVMYWALYGLLAAK